MLAVFYTITGYFRPNALSMHFVQKNRQITFYFGNILFYLFENEGLSALFQPFSTKEWRDSFFDNTPRRNRPHKETHMKAEDVS